MRALFAWLAGVLMLLSAGAAAAQDTSSGTAPPAPAATTSAAGTAPGAAAPGPDAVPLPEVKVEAPEPRYVAPTTRDRIGRIWAPVLINGKGPFRLVLDTGASHSAVIASTAAQLGLVPTEEKLVQLYGVTGAAVVPTIHADSMEVGEILMSATTLPIVADVFGGADGVLGREALPNKRILADFRHDRLVIGLSHREPAPRGYMTVRLELTSMGLLALNTRVGGVRARAIIDTGAQSTIGNLALRDALMRHPPKDARSTEIVGVTLDMQRGDNLPSPPLQLGDLRLVGLNVTFGDMRLFEHWGLVREPVVLIGMDVLGLLDVLVIDYRLRELQVHLRGADPDPPGSRVRRE